MQEFKKHTTYQGSLGELMDYGEYFIVKVIFKHMNLPKTDTLYGAVGIGPYHYVDHIANMY